MEADLKDFTPENVQSVVAAIRTDKSKGNHEFGTEQSPLSGKQCCIYVLSSQDNEIWAIRVPVNFSHLPSTSIGNFIECEVDILTRLTKLGFSYSLELIASDTSFNNGLNFLYLVFRWIEGRPPRWSDNKPASTVGRSRIIRRIVDFILDLARSTIYGQFMFRSIWET